MRGCGCVGAWVLGSVGGGGGMRMGGHGIWQAGLGLSLSDGTANRAPRASPSRIRIAGSGVIDRPTFRISGSQMRACLGWEKPHTPPTPHKMAGMPLGARRML